MVLAVASLMAQAPEKFSYQAVVRNASNALVTNAPVSVRVSILQGSANGSAVYVETLTATTNANGLLTIEIGGGTVQQGVFADIDWANGPFFLKTETDPNGGSDYSVTSTQQLLSVPYALYSKEAGNGFSGDYNDLTNRPQIPQSVGELTNDANYITINDIPDIPTVPTNVSAFNNDAGYITLEQVPAQVNADWNAMEGAAEILNKPAIPTVPTDVSAFTNDAGYLTSYTETDPQFNAWDKNYNDLINTPTIPTVPTDVSAFTNDAGYITMDSVPAIPTNVSAFTNDAGYLASYSETDPQFNAWNKDYNDLINTPTIPTVPTNISTFTNDAGYITMDSVPAIPANVSAFANDAGYITIDSVPTVVSAFENDAQYITEGELQQTVNIINSTFDATNNTIDSLRNRIDELEGYHTPPTVMTTGVADVAHTTATLNGSVVYIGGAPVSAKGFCYDTVMHPTVASGMVNCGSGSGSFSINLMNLKSSTTYFVRAYATNMWGTNYGEELSFTTLVEYLPSVEILPASDISYTSFVCSGDVTDSGTYAVTARGFCWSTEPNPVMTGEHLHLGSGAGTFSATLADMQPETTFYVRAYAVNAVGVSYSTPITVTTLTPTIPTVTTDNVSTYNRCTGTVVDDGHAPVTQRGFVYDTLTNPTLSNGVVIAEGNDLGEFSELLTGLSIGKLYFVRAFATNARGTGYGNQLYFTAESDSLTVTDYDGNVYNTVTIGTQIWMKENLKTTHYSDGWPIERGLTSSNTIAYYYYPGGDVSKVETYGLLYNWVAVMNGTPSSESNPSGVQGICPLGWHVPSKAEWEELRNYVASHSVYSCGSISSYIAKALASSIGWDSYPYQGCSPGYDPTSNNATGFGALPAGYFSGSPIYLWQRAHFWSSTEAYSGETAWGINVNYADPSVYFKTDCAESLGYSVRCLRD